MRLGGVAGTEVARATLVCPPRVATLGVRVSLARSETPGNELGTPVRRSSDGASVFDQGRSAWEWKLGTRFQELR